MEVAKIGFDIEEFKSIVSTAPGILEANKNSLAGAIKRGEDLFALAEQGMNQELDKLLAEYIDKIKITDKNMNTKRIPITQLLTVVAKEFTTIESNVKAPIVKAQKFRDEYATKLMNERKELERQAELKLAKEQEAIALVRDYTTNHANKYSEYIVKFKQGKTEWFNNLNLEDIETASLKIALFDNNLSDGTFLFEVAIPTLVHHSESEYQDLVPAMSLCFSALDKFKRDMIEFKRELIDLIPSKKTQLQELEAKRIEEIRLAEIETERKRVADEQLKKLREEALKASEEERIRLDAELAEKQRLEAIETQKAEEEKKERERIASEEAEKERIRKEDEAKEIERLAEIERQKSISIANVSATGASAAASVDSQASLFVEAPKVKEGWSIECLSPEAYLLLVSFWFENEGKTLSNEKIESKSLTQIKTFCEKWAAKNDEMIDSKLLVYKPVYKAK